MAHNIPIKLLGGDTSPPSPRRWRPCSHAGKKGDAIKRLRTRWTFSHWRHQSMSHKWLTVHQGRVANPRPVATKTGRVRMRLWLVERRDRSWLWRQVLDLQHAPVWYLSITESRLTRPIMLTWCSYNSFCLLHSDLKQVHLSADSALAHIALRQPAFLPVTSPDVDRF